MPPRFRFVVTGVVHTRDEGELAWEDDVFTGIDEVDWASLRHAYGSAEDVPALLRCLVSADRAEREVALDELYGSVHHQGNVYDSTLACVPFLFSLVAREEVPDRGGLVELLASIGAVSGDDGGSRARAAVHARADVFASLAADPDAGVRRAVPGPVVRFLDRPVRVLELLWQRITVERDDQVLLALTEALGLFVRRHPAHAAAALGLLTAQSAQPHGPGLRLAALGQLALSAPDRLPDDWVPTAVRLLRDRSAQRQAGAVHPDTDTLVGRIRRLRPSDEEGAHLLRTLHGALGDRVGERIALLIGQLTSPDPVDRCNAVRMSAGLFRGWRADHAGAVALVGAQLGTEDDQLRDAAVTVLAELFELAAPAADALDALLTARPGLRVHRWERGAPSLGGALKALARSGDPRAVPSLTAVLAGPVVPDDLGYAVVHLGPAAAPLAPALRSRLGRVAPDDPDAADRARPLLAALAALGDTEAAPDVLRLLRGARGTAGPRAPVVEQALRTLGSLGAGGYVAAPAVRNLLDSPHAVAAADTLWSLEHDETAVLPVLSRELAGAESERDAAADALARLGPAARPALPGLRRMTGSERVRERVSAACALWRIDGDPAPVLPVFRAAWTASPRTRGTIAHCLADMGPAGAPLWDLLEAEVASVRRHAARRVGFGGHDIPEDEGLLRVCREVLVGR